MGKMTLKEIEWCNKYNSILKQRVEKNDIEEQEVLDSLKYVKLIKVLSEALRRASLGKGSQRHGDDKPFTDQWILRGLRLFGIGGMQFQIGKKLEEINNLKETEAKVNELLDIIVYAAAGVIYLEDLENDKQEKSMQ